VQIYTRQGDKGTTRLAGGDSVSKTHQRLETFGTLDELNAHLGVVRAVNERPDIETILVRVQELLFEVGGQLANPKSEDSRVTEEDVEYLEREIDSAMDQCPELKVFVLPGGTPCAAHLHVARTVCRRAERQLAALAEEIEVAEALQSFVNRLSDLLFALARLANASAGIDDVKWVPRDV
jgi:cob(I)alamin adenosyltransferase